MTWIMVQVLRMAAGMIRSTLLADDATRGCSYSAAKLMQWDLEDAHDVGCRMGGCKVTPREHVSLAIQEGVAYGVHSDPREEARCLGRAAGHAFRALEILYDELELYRSVFRDSQEALCHQVARAEDLQANLDATRTDLRINRLKLAEGRLRDTRP